MIYISMDFNEVRTNMDKWPIHSWNSFNKMDTTLTKQQLASSSIIYLLSCTCVYPQKTRIRTTWRRAREKERERWEEEVFRDNKPIWSLVYKAIFFLWSQSKLVVNGITLHKEYEWANLSKEAKYKHKNITDSRHAYSALLRSNQTELVQIQMVVSLDWCVSSDFESLVCSLLLALDIFAQSFFFLNFFSKIGYFFS